MRALVDNMQSQQFFNSSRNDSIKNHSTLGRKANSGSRTNLASRQSDLASQRIKKNYVISTEKTSRLPRRLETQGPYDPDASDKAFRSIREVDEQFENTDGLHGFSTMVPSPYENTQSYRYGMHRNASDNMLPVLDRAPRASSGLHKSNLSGVSDRNHNNSQTALQSNKYSQRKRPQHLSALKLELTSASRQNFFENMDRKLDQYTLKTSNPVYKY